MKTFITLMAGIVLAAGAFMLYGSLSSQEDTLEDHDGPISEIADNEVTEIIKAANKEPIPYDYNNSVIEFPASNLPMTITEETISFSNSANELEANAKECGSDHETGYFNSLVEKFYASKKIVYTFTYNGNSQETDTYVVTVIENKANYSSMDEFEKDFDVCYAGGNAYPNKYSEEWLLFVSSCGSGFDDGSANPNGCQEIKNLIETDLVIQ